jgi:hypothetical protein
MKKVPTQARAAANYKVVREWVEALLEEASPRADRDDCARGRRDVLQAQLDLMDQLDEIP